MGALPGFLGLGGGASGTGYQAPGGVGGDAGVVMQALTPVFNARASDAQIASLQSMDSQNALLQALQAQGGLQNQSNVYNQFQDMAAGRGPNPAQAQYMQNANQIAAQTAGMIGSQKGISPALQARLIAEQGAGAKQNAAGQAAVIQAQQQLGAMQAAGNMANIMAGQQIGQTNTNVGSRQQQQNMLHGVLTGNNQTLTNMQANTNSTNANLAGGVMDLQGKVIGGIANSGGKAGAVAGGAKGGQITGCGQFTGSPMNMSAGGAVPGGPMSVVGRHLNMQGGGRVPGQAKVSGDSPKNDTVTAKLSPGEIVIPRTVVNSKNAPEAAKRFVEAVLARKKK